QEAQRGRRQERRLRHPGTGQRRAHPAVRRPGEDLRGQDPGPERQRHRHAVGEVDDHRQAEAGLLDRLRRHPRRPLRRDRGAVGRRRRQQGEGRHLRPQQGPDQGHQGRRHRVRRRPAALPPGLPRGGRPVAVQEQRQLQRRRRAAGAHRPGLRRRVQRRRHRRLRREGHPVMSMAQQAEPAVTPPPAPGPKESDGRTVRRPLALRLLARPEVGVFLGALAILIFFLAMAPTLRQGSSMSTVLYQSSTIGIMALPVALLMIGGEFDLSAGVAVITSALTASMLSYQLTMNVWVGVLAALVVSLAVGMFNGWMLVRTGLPSFLVTLGTFLILQGVNLAVTKLVTGNVATDDISDMDGFDQAKALFASSFEVGGVQVKITVVWWLVFAALATWVLLRTKYGNWIFAVGGNKESARAVGVPVTFTKISLFMLVGFGAWFVGMHNLFSFNTVQSGEGVGQELIYIAAAVIGGCLLTGGSGSAIGPVFGAFM